MELVFPMAGVRFVAVNDCYDSKEVSKLSEKFHIAIPGMMNHLYSRDLSVKVKSAKQSLIKAGKMRSSRVPYGYAKDETGEKPYIIEEETAKVVRRIFALAAEGTRLVAIAKELNNQNILSPGAYKAKQGLGRYGNDKAKECLWEYSAIRNILYDERYIGTLILGKSERKVPGNPNGSRLPKEQWRRFPDAFAAIIKKELFYEIQNMKEKGTARIKKEKSSPILYKKVKCKNCGRFMQHKDKSYYCRTPLLKDNTHCFVGYVREEILMDTLFSLLKIHVQLASNYQECISLYQKKEQKAKKDSPVCLAILERQREAFLIRKGELYEEVKQGKITKEQYLLEKEDIQEQCATLKMEQEAIKAEDKTESMEENQILKTASPFIQELLSRTMLEALIEMIWLEDRGHIKLVLQYQEFVY